MYGIATLLDTYHTNKVEAMWHELDADCGLTGVQITPAPHFSWQVVEDYDRGVLFPVLEEIARKTSPFFVHTAGMGLFTGENPVVYIPVVKDAHLLRFHEVLWEQTMTAMVGASQQYAPANWMPHITLAYGDVNSQNLGCAMGKLAFRMYDWEIKIDHLVLGGQSEDKTFEIRFPFEG